MDNEVGSRNEDIVSGRHRGASSSGDTADLLHTVGEGASR